MSPSSPADRPRAPAPEPPADTSSERAPSWRAARGDGESRSTEQPAQVKVEERLGALDVEAYLHDLRGSCTDRSATDSMSMPLPDVTLEECGRPLPPPPAVADRSAHRECTQSRHAL